MNLIQRILLAADYKNRPTPDSRGRFTFHMYIFFVRLLMDTILPTMSSAGWVTNPSDKLDRLLANFYTTDGAQSVLYDRILLAAPSDIAEYKNDPVELIGALQPKLTAYLEKYFQRANVDMAEYNSGSNGAEIIISLKVTVFDDEAIGYTAAGLVTKKDSKFMYISERFNNG